MNSRSSLKITSALAGLALSMTTAHAAPVTVNNHDFSSGNSHPVVQDWDSDNNSGINTASPFGNALWINGTGVVSQTTGTTIDEGTTYTLRVDIGQQNLWAGGGGVIRLYGSDSGPSVALAEFDSGSLPTSGDSLLDQTTSFTATAGQDTGQFVGIALIGGGGTQIRMDNVRLDASIGDNILPTISIKVPGNGATGVAVDADLVATFSEDVQKGTGNIVIKRFSDGVAVETIDVTTGAVTVSGKDVTINPPSDLADSTQFYVEIDPGAIEDLASNAFAGITGDADWNFTTIVPDLTDPTVLALSPVDEAVDVPAGTNLVVTFDEDVMTVAPTVLHDWDFEGSDDGFTVKVAGATGSAWEWGDPDSTSPGGDVTEGNNASTNCWGTNLGLIDDGHYAVPTVTCLRSPVINLTSVAGATLTFAEAMDLEGSDTAVVNIIEAATDSIIAAAIYTADDSSSTGDANWNPVPAIDLAAGVGQSVRIEWCLTGGTAEYLGWYIDDVQIIETGIPASSIIIKNASDATQASIDINDSSQVSVSGDTLTIDPASPLDASKNYAIQIGASAITDLVGNPFAGILDDITWNFSTGDGLGPIAVLNPSFEEGAWGGSDTATHSHFNPVNWSTSPSSAFRPRGSIGSLTPTDGSFQAWMNNGTFGYQDTGGPIVEGTTYTMKVDLGADQGNFPNIETVVIRLYGSDAGFGTPLAEITPNGPATTQWLTDQTVSFVATAGQATGQTIGVYLGVTSGTQVEWDNVRLEASIGGGGGVDPVITSITVSGTTATIVMKGEASTTYVCKSSDDLLTPFALIATTPATVTTDGSGNATFDVDASVARRFYLVEE